MSLTLELPADILAERKARFAEDEAAYREWWDTQSPEEQRALEAK